MNIKTLAIPATLMAFGTLSTEAAAQTTSQTYIIEGSNFWVALLSGLFLALAFQAVMTSLSFAMGMSLTPNLKEALAKHKAKVSAKKNNYFDDEHDDEDDDDHSLSARMKVVNGLGIWATVTSAIALFAAAWIAVRYNFIAMETTGLLIGLVVWALFMTLMTYFELKSIRSLTGGLLSMVQSGLQAGASGIHSVFSKSQSSRAEDMGRHAVRGIYEELSYLDRKRNLGRKVEKYLSRVTPDAPSYSKVQKDIKKLIKDIKVEEKYDVSHDDIVRELSLKIEKDHNYATKEHATQLHAAIDRAFEGADAQTTKAGKVAAVTDAMAPVKDKDAKKYREKLAKVLTDTKREELDPAALTKDIEKIVASPRTAKDVVRARLALFDRETLKALLAQHKNMDAKRADKTVKAAEKIIGSLSTKYAGGKTSAANKKKSASVKSKQMPERARLRVAAYLDSLHRPEVSYEALRHDIEDMMNDPSEAPNVVKARLAQMDRATLIAVLESNRHVSHDQAENIADNIISLRDGVMKNIDSTKDAAIKHYEKFTRRAVIQAEHTREVIMAAGWWMFVAAIVSGIAAAAGGYIGALPTM